MGSSILGVGQSALAAAQAGMATTGHNIANVNTPGYSRQVVVQGAALAQNIGVGFIGKGTEVITVKRVYDEFLSNQVMSSQTSKNSVDSYYAQIRQIDNILADPTTGVSSAMQDFFNGVQDVASNPSAPASRQAMLSSAEALAARFQSVSGRLNEIREGVNTQITTSVGVINTYAQQIADLNDAIEKAQGTDGELKPANDLLDQRDQVLSDLSKEIKVSVVKQGNTYNVFIGNGQALTVGTTVYKMQPVPSQTDPSKLQVGYVGTNGTVARLDDSSLGGGNLGGLLSFRANSLEPAINALGRVATGLAMTFNAQHQLGQAQDGTTGTAFFNAGTPLVSASSANGSPGATVTATIADPSKLAASDYRLQRINGTTGGDFVLTRVSDGAKTVVAGFPQTVDGVTFDFTAGTFNNGDEFLVRPTGTGASQFSVAVTDTTKIAAAAPIRTNAPMTNTGTGKISAGTVNPPLNAAVQNAVTITFTSATTYDVTGVGAGLPATGVAYNPATGATVSHNGWTVQLSGAPGVNDKFTVGPNTNGSGDNRNAQLLGALQTANTLGGTATGSASLTFNGAYTSMVSQVGNKTREMEVGARAEEKLLENVIAAQQAESGVNLDEEAANLMRYQQAYQAAAKVMQTASQMFELLLTLGG